MDIGELGYDYTNKVFYVGNGVGNQPTRFVDSPKNIKLHQDNGYFVDIAPGSLTGNIWITLPSENGTLLTANNLTKDIVTNALGYTPPTSDTNTTYSAGTGISLSGTTFSNSGVRSIATGTAKGTISVNTNGSSANVAVNGLGSAAYTADTDYVKLAGTQTVAGQKTFTGNIIFNASPYVVNNMLINSYGTDGKAVGMIAVTNENNLVIGHKTNSHSGDTIIRAPQGLVIIEDSNGTRIKNGYLFLGNGLVGFSRDGNSLYMYNGNDVALRWFPYSGDGYDYIFRSEGTSGKSALGSDKKRWYKLYAASASSTSSDEREKSDIMYMSDYPATYSRTDNSGNAFEQFFDRLVPATYTLNIEKTDYLHIGFIAQDVERAADEIGLPIDELGFIQHSYWKDEEAGEDVDRYALCYEEFIALNTYMIQKQKAQIKEQQEQINSLEERIAKLETLLSK